jgi:hypothetical protein
MYDYRNLLRGSKLKGARLKQQRNRSQCLEVPVINCIKQCAFS